MRPDTLDRRQGDRRQTDRRQKREKVPCPHCGHGKSAVLARQPAWADLRRLPAGAYLRFRKCDGCRHEFTTVEVLSATLRA